MARVEIILSGSPISDIRSSLAKSQILSNDLFYISQQQLSAVSPDRTYDSGTTIYNNQFKSTKMSYDALSNMMLERFREYANFGSMAWESSADYSLVKHTHNYSKVEITSYNNPTDNENQMLSIASFYIREMVYGYIETSESIAKENEIYCYRDNIGNFFKIDIQVGASLTPYRNQYTKIFEKIILSQWPSNRKPMHIGYIIVPNNKYTMWMAKPKEYHMPEPSIGQLKFLALTSIPNVNEAASDFDGWTWPDGRIVDNTNGRFSRAAAYFGDSASAPEFTLPALSNFIRPAKLTDTNNLLYEAQKQNDLLVQHQHEISNIKLESDESLECPIKFFKSGNPAGKGIGCHGARDQTDYYLEAKLIFNASNLLIEGQVSEEEQNGETYPTHNLLPVMIYIGKPNN